MLNRATQFASTTWSIPVTDLELSLEEIVGGLESRVVRAIFRSRLAEDLQPGSFVVKELRGLQRILRSWERIIRRVTDALGELFH